MENGMLDGAINRLLGPASDAIASFVFYAIPVGGAELRLIVVWLVVAAVFYTISLRFVNFWGLKYAWTVLRGGAADKTAAGETTHFQALTAALSGTVGLGNIAGVAVAIAIGGPGAAFWMTVAGFLAMATKFVECAMGHHYRIVHPDGTTSGGAMYYLSRGLAEIGWPRLGRFLAMFFALMCIGGSFGAGNMFQSNQAFQQLVNVTGGADSVLAGNGWMFGLALAGLTALVILGGIRSIARVTEYLVPLMGAVYMLAGLAIVAIEADRIPWAIQHIFREAFDPAAGLGGLLGVLIVGVQRAAFSNEAGFGSAPTAYASVRTREPMSVGFMALMEPLLDTIIICNMTAFVIVVSGVYLDGSGLSGVRLTSAAFETALPWFPYVLAVAVLLFAFSTLITWSYYGLKAWTYLVGETAFADRAFKVVYCGFTVVGAAMSLDKVIQFSDAMVFAMTFPNLIGLYMLSGVFKRELGAFKRRVLTGRS